MYCRTPRFQTVFQKRPTHAPVMCSRTFHCFRVKLADLQIPPITIIGGIVTHPCDLRGLPGHNPTHQRLSLQQHDQDSAARKLQVLKKTFKVKGSETLNGGGFKSMVSALSKGCLGPQVSIIQYHPCVSGDNLICRGYSFPHLGCAP
jgi:hypothetical protein